MGKILVVDDETGVLGSFEKMLSRKGHEVLTARRAEQALSLLEAEKPDLVVMDIRMPGMDGLDAFRHMRASRAKLPVILMTGYSTTEFAIEAMKLGAFDYQVKPVNPREMLQTIERALEGVRLMQRQVELDPEEVPATSDALIGQSSSMREVYKMIGRVAQTDATVLIRGETGTGKELVSRAIYQHSHRHAEPLRIVNCAAIPEPLLESELFGYEKGAFTGALARRIGRFEQAHKGTLLLDEIGDISPGIQAKILRALQQKRFERVGGNDTVHADVRVLAATSRNLEKAIEEGRFREDLYHRLNVVTIAIPPLRDRREDIPRLADYFMARCAGQLQIDKPLLSEDALEVLQTSPWPGNVRQLEHCIHRAMIFTRGYPLQAEDIRRALETPAEPSSPPGEILPDGDRLREIVQNYLKTHTGPPAHAHFHEVIDRLLVAEALRQSESNQSRAARLLGLSRQALQEKMQKYGIRRETRIHE